MPSSATVSWSCRPSVLGEPDTIAPCGRRPTAPAPGIGGTWGSAAPRGKISVQEHTRLGTSLVRRRRHSTPSASFGRQDPPTRGPRQRLGGRGHRRGGTSIDPGKTGLAIPRASGVPESVKPPRRKGLRSARASSPMTSLEKTIATMAAAADLHHIELASLSGLRQLEMTSLPRQTERPFLTVRGTNTWISASCLPTPC